MAMNTAQNIWIATQTDDEVPLQLLRAAGAAADSCIIILPALGVSAKFYSRMAGMLATKGFDVLILEQRGHGVSRLRPSRNTDFGFREYLCQDIPAIMDWAWQHLPGSRRIVLGHSLGGHLGAMAAGLYPEQIDGVILSACASPWSKAYAPAMRLKLHLLSGLVSLSTALLGYYPGNHLGFGGREAASLMHDWQQLLRSNRYHAKGLERDLDAAVMAYPGAVLSLRYADDPFAPAAATRAVNAKFGRARLSERVIAAGPELDRADHYQWARQPTVACNAICTWLEQT